LEELDEIKKHFRQSLLRGRRGTTAVVDEEGIDKQIIFDWLIVSVSKNKRQSHLQGQLFEFLNLSCIGS